MPTPENSYPIWDERHPLTNFAPIPVTLYGHSIVPTTEHIYQALKFIPENTEVAEQIKSAETPLEAKTIANKNKDKIRADWPNIRYGRMMVVIRRKLRQHPELQAELLKTGSGYIYEDADQYASENPSPEEVAEMRRWGIYQGEGENWMGKILMKFREKLSAGEKI